METSATEHPSRRPPLAPPGTPQLTARAIGTGMAIGGIMSLSNLYTALTAGWSFGVTITSGILAFALWRAIGAIWPRSPEFGPLENNAMQSVASAAGYMTGGGTVAAIPALMMLTGEPMPWTTMLPWVASIAMLGVFVAIPMKKQMIDIEQLRFPSGIAAAQTLRSLHSEGKEGAAQATVLGVSAAFAGVLAFVRSAPFQWIDKLHLRVVEKVPFDWFTLKGLPGSTWTWSFETSVLLLGAGAIMGMRVASSQLLGAVLNFAILAPWAYGEGVIPKVTYKEIVGWSVWFGSSLLLTSGLLSFALTWRSVQRALASVGTAMRSAAGNQEDAEVPFGWFLKGVAVLGPVVVFVQWYFFGIAPWLGAIAVLLSFFISIVACRSTGETDTTPTGALGKVTQLTFGALDPGNITTNLMTANVTGGVALHSADLLTDLKSGWLLGANPRQQFLAQFFGVVSGSLFVVPAYVILVPNADAIGGDRFPAPGAQSWAAVARILSEGIHTLHWSAQLGILLGGLLGCALVLLERAFPNHKRFIPSAMGFGLAFTMPAYNTVSMYVGAFIALVWTRFWPAAAAIFVVSLSSGLIAGEGLMGVVIAFIEAFHTPEGQ